ncbi:MAG: hypothetical protein ACTHMV_08860 [Chitinophagaceae bacterium]
MKKITIAAFSAALLLSNVVHAQKNEKLEFTKERSISKTYPASGNTLNITNTFGHVKFIAWDRNEIKVDIKIETGSSDKEMAEHTFEAINVSDGQSGNTVRFKTTIESRNYSCNNCNSRMRINYEVHLPVTVPLNVENTFGNIDLPDYKGQVAISNKFGNITTGTLSSVKDIHLEFGKAQIKSIADIDATFKFSKIQIENLAGTNKIKMEFCDSSKIVLPNNLTSLDLKESYSTINLKPASNLSASYTIRTSFGNFVDRSSIGVVRTDKPDRYGPDSDKTFEGKSGSGAVKVDIRSSFGRIILGEATAEDMKKGSKSGKQYVGRTI